MKRKLLTVAMPKDLYDEFKKNIDGNHLEASMTSAVIRMVHEYNEKVNKNDKKWQKMAKKNQLC
jgi:hypothetical protein